MFAVNQTGYESAISLMPDAGSAPWLQEVPGQPAWAPWAVAYRDTVICDGQNRKRAVFNLTEHDLQKPGEYAALKALLLSAAGE